MMRTFEDGQSGWKWLVVGVVRSYCELGALHETCGGHDEVAGLGCL